MKIIRTIVAAAVLALPILASGGQAQAATASQYSAKGHGRSSQMSNRPSRAIYHKGHHRMRHRGY